MPHYLYILYSISSDRFYIGESENPLNRLNQHNNHYFKTSFTNIADDWKIVLSFQTSSKNDALYLERFVKRMKSKRFIKKITENPEILQDILDKRT